MFPGPDRLALLPTHAEKATRRYGTSLILWIALTVLHSGACAGAQVDSTATNDTETVLEAMDDTIYRVAVNLDVDPIRGPRDAPVTIVEFADLQCPHCAQMSERIAELVKARGDQVRWILKHLPLPDHEYALPAAAATICAHDQGRAWEVHDVLMAQRGALAEDNILPLILSVVPDQSAWEGCMSSEAANERLFQALEQGMLLEVPATPTIYINGRRVVGLVEVPTLEALVDAELARTRGLLEAGVPRASLYEHITRQGVIGEFLGPTTHQFEVDESHRLGPADAPVTVVVFSDYECPFCVQTAPMLEAAQDHFGDRVALVHKHYPLTFHPGALPAARASICAGEQDKFWPFHRQLLLLQGIDDEALKSAAETVGLNMAAYAQCLQEPRAQEHILRDKEEALAAGVKGTPSVFVNGRELIHPMGPQFGALVGVIERLLSSQFAKPAEPAPGEENPTP
jgi:protein-disulfide isomerase